jgi:amino acid transporter
LFLLPFAEIRCGGTKLATKSGLAFALDNKWTPLGGGMFGKDDMKDNALSTGKEQKGNTQYFIIGALALGVIGFFLAFAGGKKGATAGIATGILSAGALIGFMLDLKKNVANSMREQALDKAKDGADNIGLDKIGNTMGDIKPTLAFSPWFYIAVIAFLAAAFFCYKRMQSSKT